MHMFSPETGKFLLNQRKGENDRRKYFMINLQVRMLPTGRRSNPKPPDLQSDAHPTEPPRPAVVVVADKIDIKNDSNNNNDNIKSTETNI